MEYVERNTVWGFNERALKNLKFVNSAWDSGSTEVHVVTQLITSLLGLIVFPYEEIKERGDPLFRAINSLIYIPTDGPNGNSTLVHPTTSMISCGTYEMQYHTAESSLNLTAGY